jgi:hypothetical protein
MLQRAAVLSSSVLLKGPSAWAADDDEEEKEGIF